MKGERPMFNIAAQPVQMRPGTFGIWTAHKALLIDEYLRSFVWVTRHGTYIDGFAGPKEPQAPHTWSAGRVVARHPADPKKRRIRHFHLVDNDPAQVAILRRLQGENAGKDIRVYDGDFNRVVSRILQPHIIAPREAAFCLLDQFSTECDWATVRKLATFPKEEFKIELFYFLMNGWFDRTVAATNERDLRRWWGPEWKELAAVNNSWSRAEVASRRFSNELGYRYVTPWPIRAEYERGSRIMYFMIHATDHSAAPLLMLRAHNKAIGPVVRREGWQRLF